jgi:hypothetical protein
VSLLDLDPDRSTYVSIFGRKGTGKSHLARTLFVSYPYHRCLIDTTKDADPTEAFTSPWPGSYDDRFPLSLRFVPNMLHKKKGDYHGWRTDVDEVVGAYYDFGRSCMWIDEVGQICPVNTEPHMDLVLHQGRHQHLTMLFCGPRCADIDPLVLSQSDWIIIFDLPHELDIKRLAIHLGIEWRELQALIKSLGEFEFISYEQASKEISICAPIAT